MGPFFYERSGVFYETVDSSRGEHQHIRHELEQLTSVNDGTSRKQTLPSRSCWSSESDIHMGYSVG